MQVEIFSLCDAATVENGKMNVLGAFDTIFAKKLPAAHPQCAVAIRVRFNVLEGNSHTIEVKFINADGRPVIAPASGTITVKFQDKQRWASANLALNIQSLKLEHYGEYSVDLSVDGKGRASLPFFIQELVRQN